DRWRNVEPIFRHPCLHHAGARIPFHRHTSYAGVAHGIAEPPVSGMVVDPATYRVEYEERMHKTGRPFLPESAWRDFVFGTGVLVVIALLAYFVGPPKLDAPPDPSNLNADPKPDWYLLWAFALLALIPPEIEGYVMILAPVIIGIVLLAAPMLNNRGERAPSR